MQGELMRETRGQLSLIVMLPSEQDDSQNAPEPTRSTQALGKPVQRINVSPPSAG
jgi:hypothetical protein